ncbi:MAG: hypothetical protein ACI4LO_09195 [Anaerovoracaceae bacterium]
MKVNEKAVCIIWLACAVIWIALAVAQFAGEKKADIIMIILACLCLMNFVISLKKIKANK